MLCVMCGVNESVRRCAGLPIMSRRVAFLTVGQPRTIAHPAAAASFRLLRSSVERDGVHIGADHFMWLVESSAPRIRTHANGQPRTSSERQALLWSRPLDRASQGWVEAIKAYAPVRLVFSNDTLPCRRHCGLRCNTIAHDAPIEWLRQFFHVGRVWALVRDYERRVLRSTYAWYVKLRADLLHLEPLRSLARLSPDAVYVASGIMTSVARYQRINDHIFVCSRPELCEHYFLVTDRTYGQCSRGFRMPWPPQQLFARQFNTSQLRLLRHAYTVARPGVGAGPECNRLDCDHRDPFATGCVAKHLPIHLEQCRSVSRRWDEWLLEADAARAAAQSSAVLRAAGRAVSARPRGRRMAE